MKIGAAIASLFISGGGQFVRGRLGRGFLFVGLDAVALALMIVFIRRALPFWLPIGVSMLFHVVAAIEAARGPDGKRPLPIGAVAGLLAALGIAPIVLSLVTRVYIVEAFKIPSGAMIPTLQVGDHIFVDKTAHDVHRGDVVVFKSLQNPQQNFIKRVIAVAGDTVELRGRGLLVNGAPVEHRPVAERCEYKDYIQDDISYRDYWETRSCVAFDETLDGKTYRVIFNTSETNRNFGPFTVGPREFFVLGDNRDNSHDSRYWGMVPVGYLRGRALSVWWSSGPDGTRKERHGLQIH